MMIFKHPHTHTKNVSERNPACRMNKKQLHCGLAHLLAPSFFDYCYLGSSSYISDGGMA